MLSYVLRHGAHNPYALPQYASMAVFLTVCDLIILIFAEPFRGVMKRGYYREAKAVFQQAVLLELCGEKQRKQSKPRKQRKSLP